jgi:hypothetical protein
MQACWKERPDDRPTFNEICAQIVKLLEDSNSQYNYLQAVKSFDIEIEMSDSDGEVKI